LDEVIQDLNDILQVKYSTHEKKENVRFSALVDDISVGLSQEIKKSGVNIITNFAGHDEMRTVKNFIYSIFFNLISNSIKYRRSEAAPVIEISSRRQPGKTVLVFKDNGLGIDMKKKGEQVFGLYKRFHH